MRLGNTARSILMIVFVGIMPIVAVNAYLVKDVTAWERQGRQAKGRPFTTELASDGCFWRTYMSNSRYVDRHIEILPDADGGHENCRYRS